MAILNILNYPDNRLRQQCKDVEVFNKSLELIVNNMLETMYSAKGIGLAAIQVNIIKRITVIDISKERDTPMILINPEILKQNDKIKFEEGCLSVPGFYEKVDRYNTIEYKAKNINGEQYQGVVEGLLAVCIQHEIDHLNGKLFVDYLSFAKRERIEKQIHKIISEGKRIQRKNIPYAI